MREGGRPMIAGFSFRKTQKGELIPEPGKEIFPHRIDIIKEKMARGEDPGDLFFNFQTPGCENALTAEQMKEESELFDQYLRKFHEEITV